MQERKAVSGLTLDDWSTIIELAKANQEQTEQTEMEDLQTEKPKEKEFKAEVPGKVKETSEISAENLYNQYEAILTEHPRLLQQKVNVTVGKGIKSKECIEHPFEIDPIKILGIKGKFKFCGTSGSNWKLTITVSINVLGHSLWTKTDTMTPSHLTECHTLNFTAAKASFCYGVRGARRCFYIKGTVSYWKFGWHEKNFDKTIYCILPPSNQGTTAPKFPLGPNDYYGFHPGTPPFEAGLKVWQTQMKKRGWNIDPDGQFGPQTLKVVKAFQKEKGLEVDGKIGPKTWAAAWKAKIT